MKAGKNIKKEDETISTGGASKAPEPPRVPMGNVVILTPAAQKEVRQLLLGEEMVGKGLRLGIKGGGCSGLSYILDFTAQEEGDTVVPYDGFDIYLDRKSTIYLAGIILDYQAGLTGRGFAFSNPMASNTCGCGESFSI